VYVGAEQASLPNRAETRSWAVPFTPSLEPRADAITTVIMNGLLSKYAADQTLRYDHQLSSPTYAFSCTKISLATQLAHGFL